MALTGAGYVPLEQVAPATGKLGKDAGWDEAAHPRWPAGAGEGQGGRFAPAGGAGSPALPQPATPDAPAGRQRVAEVVPICTRGSHSTGVLDNGLTYYMAEYHCFDGRTFVLRSLGKPLGGIIPQPR